jgi:hypothetical protein
MLPVGFELTISRFEREKTVHTFGRTANAFGSLNFADI